LKEINELNIPDDRRYSADHEWARFEGENVRIGISDYAQDQTGEIVYVELPAVGDRFDRNQVCGVVESVKSVSDFLIPVSGEVMAVNSGLEKTPNLVNESPYENGWLIEIKPFARHEMDDLMNAAEYIEMLKGE